MRKQDVTIGGAYRVKIGARLAEVTVIAARERRPWGNQRRQTVFECRTSDTGRLVKATAARLRPVPPAAVLEHEGQPFVFVHVGGDDFERRDVVVGRRSPRAAEIREGLAAGDQVVVAGGFALKSRMLSALLAE